MRSVKANNVTDKCQKKTASVRSVRINIASVRSVRKSIASVKSEVSGKKHSVSEKCQKNSVSENC